MKIVFVAIGKTDLPWLISAVDEYKNRLAHYLPFEMQVVPDLKNGRSLSEAQHKEREGQRILEMLHPGDCPVLLDDKGKQFTSLQLAAYVEKKMHAAPKRLIFIAGGPYGFDQAVYRTVAERISLSRLTFSHQMVRLIFMEQLYRAMTILHNQPYHHE